MSLLLMGPCSIAAGPVDGCGRIRERVQDEIDGAGDRQPTAQVRNFRGPLMHPSVALGVPPNLEITVLVKKTRPVSPALMAERSLPVHPFGRYHVGIRLVEAAIPEQSRRTKIACRHSVRSAHRMETHSARSI
jgi:hypothetical protein